MEKLEAAHFPGSLLLRGPVRLEVGDMGASGDGDGHGGLQGMRGWGHPSKTKPPLARGAREDRSEACRCVAGSRFFPDLDPFPEGGGAGGPARAQAPRCPVSSVRPVSGFPTWCLSCGLWVAWGVSLAAHA